MTGAARGMQRDDFRFFHPLRVRWAEVDRQDVVFNAHYFLYFDVAITEYWRALGLDYPAGYVAREGADLYAVKATADFVGSARYDDLLEVGCRIGRLGRSSAQFVLGIWRGEQLLTTGELVYVNVDVATHEARPWSEDFRSRLAAFERLPLA